MVLDINGFDLKNWQTKNRSLGVKNAFLSSIIAYFVNRRQIGIEAMSNDTRPFVHFRIGAIIEAIH